MKTLAQSEIGVDQDRTADTNSASVTSVRHQLPPPAEPIDIGEVAAWEAGAFSGKLRFLLIADDRHPNTNVVDDLLQFPLFSKHDFEIVNPYHGRAHDYPLSGWPRLLMKLIGLLEWIIEILGKVVSLPPFSPLRGMRGFVRRWSYTLRHFVRRGSRFIRQRLSIFVYYGGRAKAVLAGRAPATAVHAESGKAPGNTQEQRSDNNEAATAAKARPGGEEEAAPTGDATPDSPIHDVSKTVATSRSKPRLRQRWRQQLGRFLGRLRRLPAGLKSRVVYYNQRLAVEKTLAAKNFDAILIHWSIFIIRDQYLPPYIRRFVADFKGPCLQTIRDEYRFINQMTSRQSELGVDVLFSALRTTTINEVYTQPHVSDMYKVSTLPGCAPELFMEMDVPAIAERPLHVTYRSRELPPIVGTFGIMKLLMGERLRELAIERGLDVDISSKNEDRVYGDGWVQLHLAGKAVFSAPGGSGMFDFTGEAHAKYTEYSTEHPQASSLEIIEAVLKPYDNNIIHSQITPRTFEAIALRTALLMPVDDYRGVIEPWRHYIPVHGDFENMDEIVAHLKDNKFLQAMVDRTFDEILIERGFTRSRFIKQFDLAMMHLAPSIFARYGREL